MAFGASGIHAGSQSERTDDIKELTDDQRQEFKDNLKNNQKEYNVLSDHIDNALASYLPEQNAIGSETSVNEKKPSSKLEQMQVNRNRKKFDTAVQSSKQKETQENQSQQLGMSGRDSQTAAKKGPLASGI